MASHYEICRRWVDRELGKTDRPNYSASRQSILAREGVIYSYGTHFPLCETLRAKDGTVRAFLLNGDTFSATTTRHQSEIRAAVTRTGVPSVIIPFSALDAAGIRDRQSVELVDVSADRTETIPHTAPANPERRFLPDGMGWTWRDYAHKTYRPMTEAEIAAQYPDGRPTWWREDYVPSIYGETGERTWILEGANVYPRPVPTMDDATRGWFILRALGQDLTGWTPGPVQWTWNTHRHWLGESLIRATVRVERWTKCRHKKACECYTRWKDERGYYRRVDRTAFFLSGFDHQEPRPLYFFCELAPTDPAPETIADAYQDLKPDAVKIAEAMGRRITRQGDIFAIETRMDRRTLRKMGATFAKRDGQIEEEEYATENYRGEPIMMRRYVQTEPPAILLGTNHRATESATLPDGTTFARGILWHRPEGRDADHRRQKMADGKAWHLIVKNTVPITG